MTACLWLGGRRKSDAVGDAGSLHGVLEWTGDVGPTYSGGITGGPDCGVSMQMGKWVAGAPGSRTHKARSLWGNQDLVLEDTDAHACQAQPEAVGVVPGARWRLARVAAQPGVNTRQRKLSASNLSNELKYFQNTIRTK